MGTGEIKRGERREREQERNRFFFVLWKFESFFSVLTPHCYSHQGGDEGEGIVVAVINKVDLAVLQPGDVPKRQLR